MRHFDNEKNKLKLFEPSLGIIFQQKCLHAWASLYLISNLTWKYELGLIYSLFKVSVNKTLQNQF